MGRLGGDEFLIIGAGLEAEEQQAFIAALRKELGGIYFLAEHRISYPGASFGVIDVDPQTMDMESALRAADDAMYQDKKSRRKETFLDID